MIEAKFIYKNKKIDTIEISGHAEFDESGKDIVCAAVSTAIIVSVNAVEMVDLLDYTKVVIEEGYFKLEVLESKDILNKLLINLDYTLHDLSEQYPKYIKYQKEE